MGHERRNPFIPRSVKARGTKAVQNYTTNPRKATKYYGFNTMLGRHKGMSKYRFTGHKSEFLKGTWVYKKTVYRTVKNGRNHVMANMLRLSDGRKMTVLFINGTSERKVSFNNVYAGW